MLSSPMDYDTLLSKLGAKERHSFEMQIANCQNKCGAKQAERWRRLACVLMTLAPERAKVTGAHTVQFFIPDGKYRKQVFALHALEHGAVTVYSPNVLEDAVRAGLIARNKQADRNTTYCLAGSKEPLMIDAFDGSTPNPDFFYKDMTGWNRKAIGITLPPDVSDAQVSAVEHLCALAAMEWVEAASI